MTEPELSPVAPRSGDTQGRTTLPPEGKPLFINNSGMADPNIVVDKIRVKRIYGTWLRWLLRQPREYEVTIEMRYVPEPYWRYPPVTFSEMWKTEVGK